MAIILSFGLSATASATENDGTGAPSLLCDWFNLCVDAKTENDGTGDQQSDNVGTGDTENDGTGG